jgi:IS30 family transposase
MSNRLKMSKSQFIIALRDRGWSLTRIAQELGVHRHTVARYVDQHAKSTQTPDPDGPKSTQLHSGSDDPKSTEAPTGWC